MFSRIGSGPPIVTGGDVDRTHLGVGGRAPHLDDRFTVVRSDEHGSECLVRGVLPVIDAAGRIELHTYLASALHLVTV